MVSYYSRKGVGEYIKASQLVAIVNDRQTPLHPEGGLARTINTQQLHTNFNMQKKNDIETSS